MKIWPLVVPPKVKNLKVISKSQIPHKAQEVGDNIDRCITYSAWNILSLQLHPPFKFQNYTWTHGIALTSGKSTLASVGLAKVGTQLAYALESHTIYIDW